jgi:hypothetical protein
VRDRGPGPTACKVTQPWLRRGTAPDPSLRCSHGRKEVNDAPARLTTDPSCKDEARVGQQGTLTRVWARRGTRPRAPRDRRYAWAYLFGAVCPERAVGAALVLPYADAAATGLHRAEIGRQVQAGAHGVVVLDGAGWHAAGDLAVPENLTLLPLPRYSPELNPVENVWEYLRQNKLGHRVWPDYEAIVATCCEAWNWLAAAPDRLASITRREWAKPVTN